MNKLLLITTKGCEACKIQERIIDSAIKLSIDKYHIDFKISIFSESNSIKYVQNLSNVELMITDFPTTVFLINDNYKTHVVGTCTKEHLMHLFDEFFIEKE